MSCETDLVAELARLRVERNWTYERVARRLGMPLSTVYKLLTLNRKPNERTQYRLEKFLSRYRRAA